MVLRGPRAALTPSVRDLPTRLFLRYRERGDERALGRLFDLVAPKLLATARRLAPGPHAAEDLVQSSFLVAMDKAGRFRAEERVQPWLFGILAHEALQAKRRVRTQLEHHGRLADHRASSALDSSVESPLEAAAARETRDLIMGAIERLPSRYRSVLLMHLGEELGGGEIAKRDAAGARSPGHARVVIQRGLVRLRRLLGESISLVIPAGLAIALGPKSAAASSLSPIRLQVLGLGSSPGTLAHHVPLATTLAMKKVLVWSIGLASVAFVSFQRLAGEDPTSSSAASNEVAPDQSLVHLNRLGHEPREPDRGLVEMPADSARAAAMDPAADPPLASPNAGAEGKSDAPSANTRAASDFADLLARSLEPTPPPLAEVDALVNTLAALTVIVEDSLRYYEDGTLRSAVIELPGTAVRGQVELDGDRTRVTFDSASQGGSSFALAQFDIVNRPGPGRDGRGFPTQLMGGSATFQHHPKTHAIPPPADGPLTCGWEFNVSEERTSIERLGARCSEDGRAWILGGIRDGSTTMDGANHLAPFDAWNTKFRPILRQ